MEATVVNFEDKGIKYPVLGIYPDGNIVLFVSKNKGTCVYLKNRYNYDLGHYSDCWNDGWKPLRGEVTLKN